MDDGDSVEEEALRARMILDDNEDTDGEEQQFDRTLPASHSYMGPSVLTPGGRSRARSVEPGWQGRVPVIAHHGIVFPGETVPMLFTQDVDILSEAIQQDKMFGLLCPDEGGVLVSGYGVLCEVYEVLAAPPDAGERRSPSPPLVSFKARATHRFRCRQMPRRAMPVQTFDRLRFMDVRVLADVRLADPLRAARLAALDPLRTEEERGARRLRSMDAALTPWPLFVYEIFDFRRMRRIICDFFKTMALDDVPTDAVALSYWTASNLALTPRDRLALFVVDDALLRLHMEVGFITKKSVLCCSACAIEIARREHIFAMSTEGVHSNFINLGGFVHDVVTVSSVSNTRLSGAPSADYSWFPGYAWTVAVCAVCRAHVGWRFDARKRNLRPQQFYGLCRNFVLPRLDPPSPLRSPPRHSTPVRPRRRLSDELRAARHAFSELVRMPHAPADASPDAPPDAPPDEMQDELLDEPEDEPYDEPQYDPHDPHDPPQAAPPEQ